MQPLVMNACYEVLDERFRACFNRTAHLEKLWTGARWTEGPVYFPAHRSVYFSDIPNDRIMRYDETNGETSVFRTPCGYSNGHTVDRQGRMVSCEHGGRRVSRTEHDGRIVTVTDNYNGKRLNSPNDVVVKSDDSIWFTDPPFGHLSDYEGHKGESEIGKNCVFRVDGKTSRMKVLADDFIRPNGLAFSVDEKKIYIIDSHASQRNMRVYDVTEKGDIKNGKVFATCTAGRFDGFRLDSDGRIWTSTDEGVHCYEPDGTLIGKILVPEVLSNVVFGGPKFNRLYICATTSLYAVMLTVNGAKTF